ncbi:MAG: M14 family metallocarboxypeptidase [Verrucomicrobiota bacterium]
MTGALDWQEYQAAFRMAAEANGFSANLLADFDAGPLIAWERPADGPCVYLSAGIHGDEPAGPLALLELLREGFFKPPFDWVLCPALNPTGLVVGSRENASGIDLNRDYWTRHTVEVVAHAAWLDRLRTPDLFISLHEDWETTGFYFYEINLGEDRPDRAHHILDAVLPWFPPEPGPLIDGHDSREPGWIYHAAEPDLPEGWPEAIYLAKKGCPISFTFETPSHAELHQRVAAHVAAVKAACGGLLG